MENDSLSFKLVDCKGNNGKPIPTTYSRAYNLNDIKIDRNGTITWNSPNTIGTFNIAVEITEYRKSNTGKWTAIGKIIRDMQIDILDCKNTPPTIEVEEKYCVEAGKTLSFDVTANDIDNDEVSLKALGRPFFLVPEANFDPKKGSVPITSTFTWNTDCSLIQKNEYKVFFKADDFPQEEDRKGTSFQKAVTIQVIAPKPKGLTVSIKDEKFHLTWNKYELCSKSEKNDLKGYKIYRKKHNANNSKQECLQGVTDSNFELIADLDGRDNNNYTDTNKGLPFDRGAKYCYVVTAIFKDQAESYPSDGMCGELDITVPIITEASVSFTSMNVQTTGSINVKWLRPQDLKGTLATTSLTYNLMYAENLNNEDKFTQITNISNTDSELSFSHTGVNTFEKNHRYRVDMSSGNSSIASTPFLRLRHGDKKVKIYIDQNVPWHTDSIQIYRAKNKDFVQSNDSDFIKVGSSKTLDFIDTGLTNGKEECYKVKVFGKYSSSKITQKIINFSQIACIVPNENEIKCTPTINLNSNYCSDGLYRISWDNPKGNCANYIAKYEIHHSKKIDGHYSKLLDIENANTTEYIITDDKYTIGHFKIRYVDDVGNKSAFSNVVSLYACSEFILPNIFTPNGDGVNDIYRIIPPSNLKKLSIVIYSRWGKEVFQTNNPNINWDGVNQNTGKKCSDGVYFYACDVEVIIDGNVKEKNYSGNIHLYRSVENMENYGH
ncbi:hypothetical protein JBKA6_1080 [Ichthyobacterium seriolicida]|uniref:Uncharacterized protein n=2 Tax=Ichthyobacterium seriolicida TaxID=242600 RepID=A0A1J1E2B1_9FLAO|nr:hypothetical protein JBKA6_1080 [Ichthyobacterium seriolicida]